MWRWKVLVFLVIFFKHNTSQPVTDDSTNDRATRQLDFEECCPCFDKNTHDDVGSEELVGASSDGVLSRLRHVDDCPCRPRLADSQGASSVFFPTAMRAAGTFLSPSEKKEEVKPIFNPEVDLASSVLQTIREATDEEYQDALARDAVKSAARAAEDFVFGDATPQESANIVTIVVNPSNSLSDDDDFIPQASNIKQARCIHPLQSVRSSLGKLRLATKPSLILHRPRLPKLKPRLLHRNFFDMDSGIGASSVHEHVVPLDEDIRGKEADTSPLRILETKDVPIASNTDDCNVGKVPDFRSNSVQNNLKDLDLGQTSLIQNIRDKTTNSLSRVPKLGFGSKSASEKSNNEDLSSAPTTINEQATKKLPYYRNNSPLQNVKPKKPLSVANLLNLRDVELIPLKDLINNKVQNNKITKAKLQLPFSFSRDDIDLLNNKNSEGGASFNNAQIISQNNNAEYNANDSEGSPSLLNIYVSPNKETDSVNCEEDLSSQKSDESIADDRKVTSTEILDTIPDNKVELLNVAPTEDYDCLKDENNNQDSFTDASNHVNDIIKQHEKVDENDQKEIENQNEALESCDEDERSIDSVKDMPKLKVLNPSAVEKTLSNIKENIAKKFEDLKNIKNSLSNIKVLNQKKAETDEDSGDVPINDNQGQSEDCENGASIQITTHVPDLSQDSSEDINTTFKPTFSQRSDDNVSSGKTNVINDNSEEANECTDKTVSLQDLQKLSDSILQQEKQEQERINEQESETIDVDSRSSELIMEPLKNEVDSLEKSAYTPHKYVVEPDNIDVLENKEESACNSNLGSTTSSLRSQTDSDAEASAIITNVVPKTNRVSDSHSLLLPALTLSKKPLPVIRDVLKLSPLSPLPTLNDFKEKLTGLFDTNGRNVEKPMSIETNSGPKSLGALNAGMATDASTTSFQSRPPSSRYLEDNLDILGLKPQRKKLQSYKTKLTIPNDISLKPIKLQSALDNKHGLLGTSLLIEDKNNRNYVENQNIRTNNKDSAFNTLNKKPRLIEVRDRLDLPLEATNNIYSTLKNSHRALEAKLRKGNTSHFNKRPLKSTNVLESLSRNHEDINDKLRGLHMDLNDRLEAMHNELIDKTRLLTSNGHNNQPNFRLSSNIKPKTMTYPLKNTWKPSSRKQSQKISTARKSQKNSSKLSSPPKASGPKQFRMPTAASVPVPKTVHVPELRTTSAKWPPLTLQTSSITPKQMSDASATRSLLENSNNFKGSSSLLGKQTSPKKDSKIKVSFSTTPRPAMITGKLRNSLPRGQNSNTGLTRHKLGFKTNYQDHYESPSEIIKSTIAAPTSAQINKQKYSELEDRPDRKSLLKENNKLKASEMAVNTGKSTLKSWPKANDSSFLTKVKEALHTRISKLNSAVALRQHSTNIDENGETQITESQSDMARSASENKVIINNSSLKENVSYKCKMVCTKD